MTAARVRRRSRPRGGSSLPAALAALAISVSFTAALADLARTEVILARYRRVAAAALAAPADPVSLDAWLAGEGSHVATHGTAPPLTAPGAPLAALLGRLVAAGAGDVGALPPAGTLPGGLARVAGDLVVDAPLSGAGLLFVDGTLDIRSALDFTGLVVAAGGVRVPAGGSLAIGGALWIGWTGGSAAPLLMVDGTVHLRQSRAAMDGVDRLLPLPRRPVLLGVKDLA